MLTIKWTQPSGIISIIETKTAAVILPRTEAWGNVKKDSPDLNIKGVRGMVIYDDATIYVGIDDARLYIVNENGKTVETV